MPIVNGEYVAPTWNNDAAPAINAAELQAISDALAGGASIETGSYVGTGTYGQANPTSITFSDITPKMVIIYTYNGNWWNWADGITNTPYNAAQQYYTLNGKTLSWYMTTSADIPDASQQMNGSGTTYYYLGIG